MSRAVAAAADDRDADVRLAGGGLAAGQIALGLARAGPDLRVVILERAATLGADPTRELLLQRPVARRAGARRTVGPGNEVRFSAHRRRMGSPYNSVTGTHLHAAVTAALPPEAMAYGALQFALAEQELAGAQVAASCRSSPRHSWG